ncbi:GH16476 [Drosophila grimshawi]|uniref:GH16476 n=1 Tax=Drosophila grimshawi TaxID=7222 RepID=B4JU70_DROGR|nr:GH16476 [Drosophila grimshawi]
MTPWQYARCESGMHVDWECVHILLAQHPVGDTKIVAHQVFVSFTVGRPAPDVPPSCTVPAPFR